MTSHMPELNWYIWRSKSRNLFFHISKCLISILCIVCPWIATLNLSLYFALQFSVTIYYIFQVGNSFTGTTSTSSTTNTSSSTSISSSTSTSSSTASSSTKSILKPTESRISTWLYYSIGIFVAEISIIVLTTLIIFVKKYCKG